MCRVPVFWTMARITYRQAPMTMDSVSVESVIHRSASPPPRHYITLFIGVDIPESSHQQEWPEQQVRTEQHRAGESGTGGGTGQGKGRERV